jgi:hypothetical protein
VDAVKNGESFDGAKSSRFGASSETPLTRRVAAHDQEGDLEAQSKDVEMPRKKFKHKAGRSHRSCTLTRLLPLIMIVCIVGSVVGFLLLGRSKDDLPKELH